LIFAIADEPLHAHMFKAKPKRSASGTALWPGATDPASSLPGLQPTSFQSLGRRDAGGPISALASRERMDDVLVY
jgi:hypothetical protein